MLSVLVPMFSAVLSSGSPAADNTSMANILKMASELMTWVIQEMGNVLTFITSNTLILVFFVMTICGFVVGFLMRIWHSA